MEQPSNDTPSASLRSAAPSKREPGMGRTIQYIAQKPQHYGRFSSPLRNSKVFTFHHSTDDTPSVSHSLDSSLREGAGMGCVPFNRVLAEIRGYGRFSSPLRNAAQKIFRFLTQKRYRVGQGTHVWEPAECVTKNPLDGMYSGFWREGRGYSAEMR